MSNEVICRYFLRGICRFGEYCRFSHTIQTIDTDSIILRNSNINSNISNVNISINSDNNEDEEEDLIKAINSNTTTDSFTVNNNNTTTEDDLLLNEAIIKLNNNLNVKDPSSWVMAPEFVPRTRLQFRKEEEKKEKKRQQEEQEKMETELLVTAGPSRPQTKQIITPKSRSEPLTIDSRSEDDYDEEEDESANNDVLELAEATAVSVAPKASTSANSKRASKKKKKKKKPKSNKKQKNSTNTTAANTLCEASSSSSSASSSSPSSSAAVASTSNFAMPSTSSTALLSLDAAGPSRSRESTVNEIIELTAAAAAVESLQRGMLSSASTLASSSANRSYAEVAGGSGGGLSDWEIFQNINRHLDRLPPDFFSQFDNDSDDYDEDGDRKPTLRVHAKSPQLCPFEGFCTYGKYCIFTHGELCELCGRNLLHPSDQEQRKNHIAECIKEHEITMEISFAVQRSKDKQCGICFDVIMDKNGHEQRFGILPNCNHIFCIGCIRKWRQAKQFENKITRACPECRIPSDYVCPSPYWVDTKEDKEKLLNAYKEALGKKDCKYFKQGQGVCPFGNKCFYKHALPNGQLVDVGLPQKHKDMKRSDAELLELFDQVFPQIYLWDFVDRRNFLSNSALNSSNTSDNEEREEQGATAVRAGAGAGIGNSSNARVNEDEGTNAVATAEIN